MTPETVKDPPPENVSVCVFAPRLMFPPRTSVELEPMEIDSAVPIWVRGAFSVFVPTLAAHEIAVALRSRTWPVEEMT